MVGTILDGAPEKLRALIGQTELFEIEEGASGTGVYLVTSADGYLKVAVRDSEQDLRPEYERLLWLYGRLPVPQVLYFDEQDERQYLLISAVPGVIAYDDALADDLASVIQAMASGLRQIHSLSIADCPFDMRLGVKIADAHRRVFAGLVDEHDLDEERQGLSPQTLYDELLASRPRDEDLVFTHGDYCTPNILLDPSTYTLTGFIDWGRAGVADRYQDIALAVRSITYNFGEYWVAPFYRAYGLTRVDHAKVEFYRLLDEFF